jgi:hypothetical protein
MTNLEIRVAALQFLSLRLCAALSLEQLEEIRQSTLDGVRATDVESMQMQSEFLKLLDDAIDRARQKQAATSEIKNSVHLAYLGPSQNRHHKEFLTPSEGLTRWRPGRGGRNLAWLARQGVTPDFP